METAAKAVWRERFSTARAGLDPAQHQAEAQALARTVRDLAPSAIAGLGAVCAYIPSGDEPGDTALLDGLRAAGTRVYLPLVSAGAPAPLRWGEYHNRAGLVRGRFGLLCPAGPGEPPETLARAHTVLIPALAVDRRGVRLGRGAGYYDRSLDFADPRARLVAIVRDNELVERLPEDAHDRRVSWAATPGQGLVELGR